MEGKSQDNVNKSGLKYWEEPNKLKTFSRISKKKNHTKQQASRWIGNDKQKNVVSLFDITLVSCVKTHTCNPSIWVATLGVLDFEVSLDYIVNLKEA